MSPTPSRRVLPKRALRTCEVEALRVVAARFGPGTHAAKKTALAVCAACALDNTKALVAYHDVLLFLVAYPSSRELSSLVDAELARVARAAVRIASKGATRQQLELADSGLAGSETSATFTHEIASWLAARHPARAEVDAFGDTGSSLAEALALCLPSIEAEMLATAGDPIALLDEAKGQHGTRLGWLLRTIDRLKAPRLVRAYVFDSLAPVITIRPGSSALSRTRARAPTHGEFLHDDPLVKQLSDPLGAIREPLSPSRSLSPLQRRGLIDVARASLAMLGRETDPITWPSPEGVALYDLGRGAAVALFPMHPSRRFALDSHTGYLLLRNGVPVGYGGGWPFIATCRTGTNIFLPFRGGESSWLFAQALRVYRQHFGVKRFLIEPYQFGAGNREGLRSGAFWFYYRLGFRPVDPDVATAARAEFNRFTTPGYRSPLAAMRALTGSDIALDIAPTTPAERCEPAQLSFAVSAWIANAHRGNRDAALKDAARRVKAALGVDDTARWPAAERDAFHSLSLVVALIPDLESWAAEEREACVALMRAKGAPDDSAYFRALSAHPRLPAALASIAMQADQPA